MADPRWPMWEDWIERIWLDVCWLRDTESVWNELIDMVETNPEIPEPGPFLDWIRDLYAVFVAVGIRRQADPGNENFADVVTLRRLLDDIAEHPEQISREAYIARYDPDRWLIKQGHAVFDRYAGFGGAFVDPAVVRADVAKLKSVTGNVSKYVNKHVAHHSEQAPKQMPRYKDLTKSLNEISELLKRYYLLVKVATLVSTTPTRQENWKLPFLVPWAPNPQLLDAVRRSAAEGD